MHRPAECAGCPFNRPGDGFVPFDGPRDARLVIIGESPGADEENEEKPFVGPSGKMLAGAMRMAGVDRKDVLVGNTILCRPPRPWCASDKGWQGAIAHCGRVHTGPLLASLPNVKAVLVLGGPALLRHTGMRPIRVRRGGYSLTLNGIENVRGSAWKASELAAGGTHVVLASGGIMGVWVELPKWQGDPWIVAGLHPAFIRRGNLHLKPLLASDVDKARELSVGPGLGQHPTMADDFAHVPLKQAVAALVGQDLTFDVEVDANGNPNMIGISDGRKVYSFVGAEGLKAAREALRQPGGLRIGHNLAFDVKALGGLAEIGGRPFDTIIAAALVEPSLPRALSDVASVHAAGGYVYWKDVMENPRTQAVLRLRMGLPAAFAAWDQLYNGLDVWWTEVCYRSLRSQMRSTKTAGLFTDIQMPMFRELLELEANGMLVDQGRASDRRQAALQEMVRLQDEISGIVADRIADRRWAASRALTDVRAAVDSEIGQLPRCPEHLGFLGGTKRTACPDCNELWKAASAVRARFKKQIDTAKRNSCRVQHAFSTTSPMDWAWILFAPKEVGGFELKSKIKTKTNRASMGKNAIKGMLASAGLPDDARTLLTSKFRLGQLGSRVAKYLTPPLEADGRVHPAYALHKTLTGRTSSGVDDTDAEKPTSRYAVNAQNWPEDCRSIIVAPTGHVLVNFDFKAIEAFTTAMAVWKRTGSRAYWDLLWTPGLDIHTMTAGEVEKVLGHPITRYQGKRVRHMWSYGASPKMMAIQLAGDGVTLAMATAADRALAALHPDIVEWRKATATALLKQPALRNPFGRICHFTVGKRASGELGVDDPNSAVAWEPQSTAHDIVKTKWLEMRANGVLTVARMFNHSHDSFGFEVDPSVIPVAAFIAGAKAVLERPVGVMASVTPDGKPFAPQVEVQAGQRWAQKHVHGVTKGCPGAAKCKAEEVVDGLEVWDGR